MKGRYVGGPLCRRNHGERKMQTNTHQYGCRHMMWAKPASARPQLSVLNCGLPSTPASLASCAAHVTWPHRAYQESYDDAHVTYASEAMHRRPENFRPDGFLLH